MRQEPTAKSQEPPKIILHVDMDAFFAAVEVLDNPDLKGECLVVGGRSDRGVVAAASYEARKFGIFSAMPIFQAWQRCKRLVIVPPRRRRYSELSKRIMSTLRQYSPLVEPVSIDEAYVDVSGCERLFGSPRDIGLRVKQNIKDAVRLTCSVGVAPNKFLAKIASDMDKPDGLFVIVDPEEVRRFLARLPIQKVAGVGRKSRESLKALGIHRLGDVAEFPESALLERMGKFGHRLIQLSQGIDDAPVAPWSPAKSISSEHTLAKNTRDVTELETYILHHAEDVGRQLRRKALKARTINLKLKSADFKINTRSSTLKQPTRSSKTIFNEARRLLRSYRLVKDIRLVGVGVSGLVDEDTPIQADLFDKPGNRQDSWDQIDDAVDAITDKFGKNMVQKARLKDLG
jgi:DNA polymerase IV